MDEDAIENVSTVLCSVVWLDLGADRTLELETKIKNIY